MKYNTEKAAATRAGMIGAGGEMMAMMVHCRTEVKTGRSSPQAKRGKVKSWK